MWAADPEAREFSHNSAPTHNSAAIIASAPATSQCCSARASWTQLDGGLQLARWLFDHDAALVQEMDEDATTALLEKQLPLVVLYLPDDGADEITPDEHYAAELQAFTNLARLYSFGLAEMCQDCLDLATEDCYRDCGRQLLFVWTRSAHHPEPAQRAAVAVGISDYAQCRRYSLNSTITPGSLVTAGGIFLESFILGTLPPTYVCPATPAPDPRAPAIALAAGFAVIAAIWPAGGPGTWFAAIVSATLACGEILTRFGLPALATVVAAVWIAAVIRKRSPIAPSRAVQVTRASAMAVSCAAAAFPETAATALHALQHGAGACGG